MTAMKPKAFPPPHPRTHNPVFICLSATMVSVMKWFCSFTTENKCSRAFIWAFIILGEHLTTTSLEVTVCLALVGILHKTDKQLALLCFGLFIIKREKLASFAGLCYCHYPKKEGNVAICNKRGFNLDDGCTLNACFWLPDFDNGNK